MRYNENMGTITDITKQRNGKRANIFVDGVFTCGLELITVASAHLKVGDPIDEETLTELQRRSETEKAFDKAVGYLSTRRRTCREVRVKLKEKGYLPAVVDDVVNKLSEYGYLDDRKFCEEYIDVYKTTFGAYRIAAELKHLGVESALVSEVLDEKLGDEEKENAAVAVVEKYLRTHTYDKMKLVRYAAARGFSYGDVMSAVDILRDRGALDETDDTDDDWE